MASVLTGVAELPVVARYAVVGAVAAGIVGGLVGLVVGLFSYVPTAWFAVLEVGVPSALLGALAGALVGVLSLALHRRTARG